MQQTIGHADDTDVRFGFGENWRAYLDRLDADRIDEAEKSLRRLLARDRLVGVSFLDVGSGSGLFSLAARRLGARVHSFDYDPVSVECTKSLQQRFFPNDANWVVERGSILDADYVARLGQFDIVYSWGVLHHTGAMLVALANAGSRVDRGGVFAFALYRKTGLCWAWTIEKRWYANASPRAQRAARALYRGMMRVAFLARGQNFDRYVSEYRSNRGMDFINDVHDWMGGFPYESIRPAEIAMQMARIGFAHVCSFTRPFSIGLFGSGCDEFVYRRPG